MRPSRRSDCPRLDRGFSLVELLVVISVMVTLLSMSVSLMGGSRAGNVTRAGNMVADCATLARQSALSRGRVTALVLVEKAGDTGFSGGAVCVVELNANGAWVPLSNWELLPEGVIAEDQAGNGTKGTDLNSLSAQPADIRLHGKAVDLARSNTLIFFPDGRMSRETAEPYTVRVRHPEGGPNFYDVVLNSNTSSIKVIRP